MDWRTRVVAWGVRRTLGREALEQGRVGVLCWVDQEGGVHQLGEFAITELEGVGRAMATAWRLTRDRGERVKLGPTTHVGARLARAARQVARELEGRTSA